MSQRAIDPSEIILDPSKTAQDKRLIPNPWLRFLSRFLDYAWFLLLLWGLKILCKNFIPPAKYASFAPFEYAAWIPLEAALLCFFGSTPGKKFLGIQLWRGRQKKFPFRIALKRSFQVWLRGLGMMIPVINVFCLGFSYYRLVVTKTTSWDREEAIQVRYTSVPSWRIVLSGVFTTLAFFTYFHNS